MFGSTKHCPVCGMDVNKESGIKRFGKYLCSEEHAQQYVEQRAEEEENMAEERRNSRDRGSGCC